jgi:hypothetical protein
VTDADGTPVALDGLGDWSERGPWERFGGTLTYVAQVTLPRAAERVVVDLGPVGEAARVRVNGIEAGTLLWAPFGLDTPGALWRPGANDLSVEVTNSAANAYEGALRPSGLIGPVQLRAALL